MIENLAPFIPVKNILHSLGNDSLKMGYCSNNCKLKIKRPPATSWWI